MVFGVFWPNRKESLGSALLGVLCWCFLALCLMAFLGADSFFCFSALAALIRWPILVEGLRSGVSFEGLVLRPRDFRVEKNISEGFSNNASCREKYGCLQEMTWRNTWDEKPSKLGKDGEGRSLNNNHYTWSWTKRNTPAKHSNISINT